MAEKPVSVRFQTVGGDKLKAEFVEIGREGKRAFDGIRDSSTRSGPALQNAAFQVGDFFVQVSSGQSATRALAQQLPQLLGGFGLFGALAGAGVAALAALIPSLIGTGEEAQTLSDLTDDLTKKTKAYNDAAELSRATVQELAKDYLSLSGAVERARDVQEAQARNEAEASAGALTGAITGALKADVVGLESNQAIATAITGYDALIRRRDLLLAQQSQLIQGSEEWLAVTTQLQETNLAVGALDDVSLQLDLLSSRAGVTREEFAALVSLANELSGASLENMAASADALSQELVDVYGSTEAVDQALPGVLATLASIVTETARWGVEAENAAAIIAAAQRELANIKIELSPGGQANIKFASRAPGGTADQNRLAKDNAPETPRISRGGGARIDPGLVEAQRLFESTRTSAENYAEEVERINELHRLFPEIVTQEVVDRGLKELQEQLGQTDGYARKASQAIRSAFTGLFDDPKEALEQLGKQLLQMALFKQLAASFPSAFGAGGLIPLPSFAGGGDTGTGARSGGLDGRGGFLAMLHPNETVTDHNRGGGGGTSVLVQNFTGAPAREERSTGPDGRELIKVVVGEETVRGSFDRPNRARFGNAPQPVRR